MKRAQAESEGKTVEAKKPIVVKYGLNHVTYLIEQVDKYVLLVFMRVSIFSTNLVSRRHGKLSDIIKTLIYLAEQGTIGCHCS